MEIEEIYRAKEFDEDLVEQVTDKITSNKKVWLKTMLTEELELNLDIVGNPIKGAFIMFVSFIIGGVLPILPYLLSRTGFVPIQFSLWIAIAISLTSSFRTGAKKAKCKEKLGQRRNRNVWFRNWYSPLRIRNRRGIVQRKLTKVLAL